MMICPFGSECSKNCALSMVVKRDGRVIGHSCAIAVSASGEYVGSTCVARLSSVYNGNKEES